MSPSGKSQQQLSFDDKAIPLSDLMEQHSSLEPDYQVIEPEKPKRKCKPKDQRQLQIPFSVAVGIAIAVLVVLIGFIIVALLMFTATGPVPIVVPQPIEQAAPVEPNGLLSKPDRLVDRWMVINKGVGEIAPDTFVRVLSQDNSPEFYNVADMQGHLTIVSETDLSEAANAPSESLYPPLGPYSTALGKNQKLLVTVEWNNGMPPGTLVYAMGWRAEDGTWIYEVSPDRVKIYYLPWIHLKWADGVTIPTT